MDCPCGGIISLTHEMLSSEEATKRFPNQKSIIPKNKIDMYTSFGTCGCGRLALLFSSGKQIQPKQSPLFSLFKRQ